MIVLLFEPLQFNLKSKLHKQDDAYLHSICIAVELCSVFWFDFSIVGNVTGVCCIYVETRDVLLIQMPCRYLNCRIHNLDTGFKCTTGRMTS